METRIAELRQQKQEFEGAWQDRARRDALQDVEIIGYTDFLFVHTLQKEDRELWAATAYHEQVHDALLERLDWLQDRMQEWEEEGADYPRATYLDAWIDAVAGYYKDRLEGYL